MDISLYISHKTRYFQNDSPEVIPYPIFMTFTALNAEINIVSSSYNIIIFYGLTLRDILKDLSGYI